MTDKDKVLQIYPDAFSTKVKTVATGSNKWLVFADQKMELRLGTSFTSEDIAWNWASSVVNKNIIDLLSR